MLSAIYGLKLYCVYHKMDLGRMFATRILAEPVRHLGAELTGQGSNADDAQSAKPTIFTYYFGSFLFCGFRSLVSL